MHGKWVLAGGAVLLAVLCGVSTGFSQDAELITRANQFFKPLPDSVPSPKENPSTPEKITLGRMLYFEPRLSKSGVISCNSCHNLGTGGVDNLPTSPGHLSQLGGRNSPTVLNAALQTVQFWDGRAASLEEQAKGPILNPIEMAMPGEEAALERLRSMPEYVERFQRAFPGERTPVTYQNVARAIAAFERTLLTPSRFDEFLKGNAAALSTLEQEGLSLVIQKGCITCHNGVGAGGGMLQKFGIQGTYEHSKDQGRYEVTKKEADRLFFKVPMWRNVTRTAPYFHDGAVWDLKEAVRIMGRLQLGLTLTDDEVDAIVAFLHSLEGAPPAEALQLPILPSSTATTPRPSFK